MEVSRIFGVLDRRLEGRPYFAGDEYTIADIAFLPWIRQGAIVPLTQEKQFEAFIKVTVGVGDRHK
ncbi:glutathione binding-like protein [Paraburkholderia sp. CNPSo 3076]|uniref:glutathione binding-like protein n=1 Tax=Paraburkholderia sp. CNPSo 3076 TaxID=2940936 RepID=UPI003A520C1E